MNVHDTDGTKAFDAFEVPVAATSLGEARPVGSDLWSVAYGPQGGIVAVHYDGGAKTNVVALEGGPDVGVPHVEGFLTIRRAGAVLLARATVDDPWFRLDPAQDRWVETTLRSN